MNKAKKENWKTVEFPATFKIVRLDRPVSDPQFEQIKIGFIPQEMEDKWFIYLEDHWLYFHRSWTGYCIFKLRIENKNGDYILTELYINQDKNQYEAEDDLHDINQVENLIDTLMA